MSLIKIFFAIAFYEGLSSIEILAWVKHFIVSLLETKELSVFVKWLKCDTAVDKPFLLVFVKETSSQHEPIMMLFFVIKVTLTKMLKAKITSFLTSETVDEKNKQTQNKFFFFCSQHC